MAKLDDNPPAPDDATGNWPEAVMMVDEARRIQAANQQAAKLFGYEPGELAGMPLENLVDTASISAQGQRVRVRGRRQDGSGFVAEVSLVELVAAGEPAPAVVLVSVAARPAVARRDTAAVEELNSRLIASLDSIADPIFMMDRNMCYTFANKAATVFAGMARSELLGRNVWELSPWLRDTPFGRSMQRAIEATEPFTIEDYYRPRDRWLNVSYFPGTDGFTVHITDINELKRNQHELGRLLAERANVRQMRRAFDLMPHPMVMVDSELRYTYANAAAREPNQRMMEEMIGTRMWDLNPTLKESELVKQCRKTFRTGERQQFETILPPSGRWFQMETIPWSDQVILSAVDITLLKKSQESVGILTTTLEQAMDAGWDRPTARDTGKARHNKPQDD